MKVLVLGAGVAGVSSAWYLAEAGHEVTVIDRAKGVAMETSFANAGQLSYGYTTPWAAPGIPTKALKWLLKAIRLCCFAPTAACIKSNGCGGCCKTARQRTIKPIKSAWSGFPNTAVKCSAVLKRKPA